MSVIWKGSSEGNAQAEIDLVPGVGRKFAFRHTRSYDAAVNLAQQYMSAGFRAQITQEGDSPLWQIRASVDGDPTDPTNDIQNTHELRVNVETPDVRANPVLFDTFSDDANGTNAALRINFLWNLAESLKENPTQYATSISDLNEAGSPIPVGMIPSAVQFLNELLLGQDTYITFSYVYVHTFNFGTFADLEADWSNTECIFTTAQVISEENVPARLNLPDGEWLKVPPEEVVPHGQRESLKYEYWWKPEYSRLRYAEANLAP